MRPRARDDLLINVPCLLGSSVAIGGNVRLQTRKGLGLGLVIVGTVVAVSGLWLVPPNPNDPLRVGASGVQARARWVALERLEAVGLQVGEEVDPVREVACGSAIQSAAAPIGGGRSET